MCETISDTLAALRSQVAALDVARMSAADARAVHEQLAKVERLAVAGRTLAASAIDRTGAFREAGHRSAASYVAATTGTTMVAAAATVATARALPSLGATREALIAGLLSAPQAAAVAAGATADPSAEPSLLEAASREGVSDLRRRALMVRAAAPGGESRLEALRATRYVRQWDDEDGMYHLEARLPADDGAKIRSVVDARAGELIRDGRRSGWPISPEHAAADALVGIMTGNAFVKTVVNVHVDATALDRGALAPGERCEIAGSGPISVGAAKRLMLGGWVNVIERAGVDVQRVAHLGRMIPAHVRSAADARYPKCAIASCANQHDLEYDHRVPLEERGETSVHNIWKLCRVRCHYLKTHHGWLPVQQKDGTWKLTPPARPP